MPSTALQDIDLRLIACRLHHQGHYIDPEKGGHCRFCRTPYMDILHGTDRFFTYFKSTDISIRFEDGGPWYAYKTFDDLPPWALELYASTRH